MKIIEIFLANCLTWSINLLEFIHANEIVLGITPKGQRKYMKYKLNVSRDVDTDEPDVFILNLPAGWKFNHDPMDLCHTYAYDSMKELRDDIKFSVKSCDCAECKRMAIKQ